MARGDTAYLAAQSCYIILVNARGEWLFIHRANTGYQDGLWSLPGGHVKEREPIDQAARREAQEEVGVALDPGGLELAYVLQRNKQREGIEDRVDHYFITHAWRGTPENREPQLHDQLAWFRPDDLPADTVAYIRLVASRIGRQERFGSYDFEPSLNER